MSSAFVREAGTPQIFLSRDSAESAAKIQAGMDGETYTYEVRQRTRGGGYMVARLDRNGTFEGWIEE
jgi:hypothetical protein